MAGTETEAPASSGTPASSGVGQRDDARGLRQHALLELARRDKSDLPATLRAVTEGAAAVLDVARASVWRLEERGTVLSCLDLFLAQERAHVQGERLLERDAPHYFQALLQARALAASDAHGDPRTHELREGYLEPLGIRSMLDVPIWCDGRLYGVLCLEHRGPPRTWLSEEADFATNLSDIVALALTASEHARSERRWGAVFEAMTECVIVVDARNEVLLMNPTARALFARSGPGRTFVERQAVMDFYSLSGQRLPPERWPGPRALRGEYIRGELAEVRLRATGERRFFRITTAPLYEGDALTGGVLVFSDVTEQMHFERLKRDFLAALAHELRTPVTITQLSAQHVARARELPPPLRPRMQAVIRAASRMGRLVDDIVEISSIMLEDLVLERRPVELGALVRTLAASRGAPGERLLVEASEPLSVLADPERLAHALRHLVDNALRYAPSGPVRVRVQRSGARAEVCVQDQGIGIPKEAQPHLFELFYRAHAGTPHDVGGMGIGLFLCRELLRLHGGGVRVESTEGEGSTFCAWLPMQQLHAADLLPAS